ncbi:MULTISPECIES: AAA family ATPase [Brasilonema]|uniref:AAA family ATPase n=1 Tax=Brasilonema TaxID=383614 RepID=UPI001FEB5812|nr:MULTISPECIES: ATP-binding protein [Brasilonema]
MVMLPNPFTPRRPVAPERFVGRIYEIAAACALVNARGHVAIWGGPGMGKRSLLEKLASPQTMEEHGLDPSVAVVVLLSCESITPFTPYGFWEEVLKEINDKLDRGSQLQVEIETFLGEGGASRNSLRHVLKELGRQNKFLLLLVDDFDVVLSPNEKYAEADMVTFLSECRSLAVHCHESKYLSMIVTSRKRLNELNPTLNLNASPWFNHYLFLHLQLFTEQEVEELLKPLTTQMTLQLRENISQMAGRHPTLLQIAGFHLYNLFNF